MKLFRIGDKVISRDKLLDSLDAILQDRESGATQEEAARNARVQRSFVSFLETMGEVRRGPRVAVVAFPVSNGPELQSLAERHGVDLVLAVSQAERESIESGNASDVFNRLLETMALLRDFDTVVLVASDWRIKTIERILGTEVVGVTLGQSPIREDVQVDLVELDDVLSGVMSSRKGERRGGGRVGRAFFDAAELAGRWTQSRKSSA